MTNNIMNFNNDNFKLVIYITGSILVVMGVIFLLAPNLFSYEKPELVEPTTNETTQESLSEIIHYKELLSDLENMVKAYYNKEGKTEQEASSGYIVINKKWHDVSTIVSMYNANSNHKITLPTIEQLKTLNSEQLIDISIR